LPVPKTPPYKRIVPPRQSGPWYRSRWVIGFVIGAVLAVLCVGGCMIAYVTPPHP
jgi:hypothetical protein